MLREGGMEELSHVNTIANYERRGFNTEVDGYIWLSNVRRTLLDRVTARGIRIY